MAGDERTATDLTRQVEHVRDHLESLAGGDADAVAEVLVDFWNDGETDGLTGWLNVAPLEIVEHLTRSSAVHGGPVHRSWEILMTAGGPDVRVHVPETGDGYVEGYWGGESCRRHLSADVAEGLDERLWWSRWEETG